MAITKTAHFALTVFSVPDFNLVLPQSQGNAYAGQIVSIVATAESIDQFAGEVVFSIAGVPAGTAIVYFPNDKVTIAPGSPGSVQIQLSLPADNAIVGVYDLIITAESTVYNGS